MSLITTRRIATAAIPALALGLAACSGGPGLDANEELAAQLSPEQVVLASYEGLEGESYKLATTMTVNGLDFLDMTSVVEGGATQASQDLYMSAILEAMGEEIPDDPEVAQAMEALFADVHSESILVDGVVYLQISGGTFDMTEQFGADAWFTADVAEYGLDAIYEQFGGFDLASQTETLLSDLTDVEETGDGVYTGTLRGDSEAMQAMLGTTSVGGQPGAEVVVEAADVVITVDGEGLLETMEMTFPETEGMTLHMISEVVEVGGDYRITAPESDNLHSLAELVGGMQ